jgi:hypothetical protein
LFYFSTALGESGKGREEKGEEKKKKRRGMVFYLFNILYAHIFLRQFDPCYQK